MKHFKVKTISGTEDVYCEDFDESDKEYWFLCHTKPNHIFQKANVISYQEVLPMSHKTRQELMNEAKGYSQLLKSKQLERS